MSGAKIAMRTKSSSRTTPMRAFLLLQMVEAPRDRTFRGEAGPCGVGATVLSRSSS